MIAGSGCLFFDPPCRGTIPIVTPENAVILALNHFNRGRLAEAQSLCAQVLAQDPNNVDALQLQSLVEAGSDRLDSAIALINRAISLKPFTADYFVNLGEFQRRMGQLDQARATLEHAIALQPDHAAAHYNLGIVLTDQSKADDAMAQFHRAIALDENLAEAHVRIGNELRRLGRLEDSMKSFERAIVARPQFAEAHWNYSLLLLQHGDLKKGWAEYEWRRRIPSLYPPRNFPQPQWMGQPLNGQRVFLHIEQALGDMIQFARFAPLVADRGGRVLVQSLPELAGLFTGLRGVEQVVPAYETVPPFDLHCPLLSLGGFFCPDLSHIPSENPYLHPNPALVDQWRKKIEPYDGKLKVGLAWHGRQMIADGGNRSIPSPLLAPLAEVDGAIFFHVQPPDPEAEAPPVPLIDWRADLRDFTQTAALLANLDLVISIDTAVAHLAGALGRPVWTLLLHYPDWRWLLDRQDSPWYPTMRLFRQPKEGDWERVIDQVVDQLKNEATQHNIRGLCGK